MQRNRFTHYTWVTTDYTKHISHISHNFPAAPRTHRQKTHAIVAVRITPHIKPKPTPSPNDSVLTKDFPAPLKTHCFSHCACDSRLSSINLNSSQKPVQYSCRNKHQCCAVQHLKNSGSGQFTLQPFSAISEESWNSVALFTPAHPDRHAFRRDDAILAITLTGLNVPLL